MSAPRHRLAFVRVAAAYEMRTAAWMLFFLHATTSRATTHGRLMQFLHYHDSKT
jgi:hypothetical protein